MTTQSFFRKGKFQCSGHSCWLPALQLYSSNWVPPRSRSACFQWHYKPLGYWSPPWLRHCSGKPSRSKANNGCPCQPVILPGHRALFTLAGRGLPKQSIHQETIIRFPIQVSRLLIQDCLMALLTMVAIAAPQAAVAAEATTRYQTVPGSSTRDYRAPSFVTKGDTTYRTLPGSSTRDYKAPSYVTKGDTTYQTLPGSSTRDYRAPSFVTKGDTTYQTLPG